MYNPVTLINKKDRIATQISNVVREVSPAAYDIHTGDNSISNQVIYPSKNHMPPRMVTYIKAGTVSDITFALRDLIKLINGSNDLQLQVKAFVIGYLAPNQIYNYRKFITILSNHFNLNPAQSSSIVNTMVNQGILKVHNNKIVLVKPQKVIDITNRNDPSTNNFKRYIKGAVISAEKQHQELYKNQHTDSFGNEQPEVVSNGKGLANPQDLAKIKHLMSHIKTRKITSKNLNHQISKDIANSNQYINRIYRGKITKKYTRAVKVIDYVLDNHLTKFTYKDIYQRYDHKTASVLNDLMYDGILKHIHRTYSLNSHYLCIAYRNSKLVTVTTDRSGTKPYFFKYIIK